MAEGLSAPAQAGAVLGCAVLASQRLHGGDLSAVWRLTLGDGRVVVVKQGPLVASEAAMLRAIAASGAPAPPVIACRDGLLIMGRVDGASGPAGAWSDLAHVLRRLHARHGTEYGWPEDYAFGPVAIANARCDRWPEFWAGRRLMPFVPYLPSELARRVEAFASRIQDHLPQAPPAALLHGDLWGGNVMATGGRIAALIDPACYHGDREVDLAMPTLFDHPPDSFFADADPAPGWRDRLPAYRLWPLLVHFRLFGASYRSGIEQCLRQLGH